MTPIVSASLHRFFPSSNPRDAPMAATVLVVDDEPAIVEIIQDILESRGYRGLSASDSARALAMLDEDPGPIHLLLTDVIMPNHHSGPELAERVQHRWPD